MNKPVNLLIVRTDRIGDVVLSLPLAAVVKKNYPDCRITFLVREYTEPLTKNNPDIDEVIILKVTDKKVNLKDNIKELRKRNFDTVIMVYPTFALSVIIYFSRIKERIGTGYRWYSILFNRRVYEHRKYAEKHELEYNLALLEQLAIKNIGTQEIEFHLPKNKSVNSKAAAVLKDKGVDLNKKLIIMHPGSGGSAVNLPVQKFRELAEKIISGTDSTIIVTGSSDEKDLCENLVIGNRTKNLAGLFSLTELIEVIRLSSIFISNSTGPLHIAAALNKYVIGFYPKVQACSAKRWGPYTDKGFVFIPEMDCTNCTVEQCIKLNCMNSIDINNVFEKIEKILKLLPNTGEIDAF